MWGTVSELIGIKNARASCKCKSRVSVMLDVRIRYIGIVLPFLVSAVERSVLFIC
jgi:hypothetical protein